MVQMSEVRGLTWWFFWRFAIASWICSAAAGGLVGTIIGFTMGAMGYPVESIRSAVHFPAIAAGFLVSFPVANYLFAKMIGRDFGGRRLDLGGAQFTES